MRRLYFLLPGVDSAKTIVDELLLARIEERHIHIAAKDHHALTDANLPEANLLQESDFVPAVERGLALGGATGVVAGIAAVAIPAVGRHHRRSCAGRWRHSGYRPGGRRCRCLDLGHDRHFRAEYTALGIRGRH